MSGAGLMILLLAIWLLLWGSLTVANVVSGIAVVLVVVAILPDARIWQRPPPMRPVATARFGLRIAVDLFKANWVVTREILTPASSINTGVVAVPVPHCSDGVLTLVANVLALTPGTMPLEVTRTPPVIYVHILHLHDLEAVRHDVRTLSDLAIRAFGSAAAVAALDNDVAEGKTLANDNDIPPADSEAKP
ncbi:MAG: Na+/H+ antiporter subunit E [Aquihabitans sp.]